MKKLFLTSAIIAFVSCPAFATVDVDAEHKACDNTTLHTYSAPASLEADWTANTITLDWYNGNTKVSTNSCTYDGAITLPTTNPSKDGYTFAGWQVRAAAPAQQTSFDLRTLNIYTDGIDYGHKSETTVEYGEYSHNTDKYGIDGDNQWVTEFSYGIIRGISKCETGYSEDYQEIISSCYCQATGFDADKNGTYLSVIPSSWYFIHDHFSVDECKRNCPEDCAYELQTDTQERASVFGLIEQYSCEQVDGYWNGTSCEYSPDEDCLMQGGVWNGSSCDFPW